MAPAKLPGSARAVTPAEWYLLSVLVARDDELARLAEAVENGRKGSASSLLIRGEAGVGKTALLDAAVAAIAGATVLRAQGLEVESPLAFAALQRVLRPIMRFRDQLPVRQARALGVAFGEDEGAPVEPFLIGVATLGLITAAAEEQFIVCCVDDAQWLDAASADALLFCQRRLGADRVVMVFTVRDGLPSRFEDSGLIEVSLSGLDPDAARELLNSSGRSAGAREVLERLVADARGNPLALIELSGQLTEAQLDGSDPLPPRLELTSRLEDLFLESIRKLPSQAQSLLLLVAADDSGSFAVVSRAAAAMGLTDQAVEDAQRSGLLQFGTETVDLRHPLVRSAVYQSSPQTERRRAHAALAEALSFLGESDRATWQRAAATDGPDAALVTALEEVGTKAQRRGAHASASAAFQHAAILCADAQRKSALKLQAARSAWANGQPSRAQMLLQGADELADDEQLRADIARLRGHIEVNIGSAVLAHRLFIEAARAVRSVDPDRALELLFLAATLRAFGIDSGTRISASQVPTESFSEETPRIQCLKAGFEAMSLAADGHTRQATDALHRAVKIAVDVDDREILWNLGNAALQLGDDQSQARAYSLALARAREAHAVTAILYVLQRICFSHFVAGDFTAVRRAAEDALSLSSSIAHSAMTALPVAWLTLIAAYQSNDDYNALLTQLETAAQSAQGILADPVHDLAHWAKAVRAAAGGDRAEGLHHLSRMRFPALARMAALDRLDTAVRAEEPVVARAWVEELAQFSLATQNPWALGAVAYGRARTDETANAEEYFQRALLEYGRAERPFDEARVQLAYGEWLRRAQRRVDARRHLRRALETFQDMHVEYLAERAAQELRASGENARKRDPSSVLKLTPMELKIAQLVSSGLSNKDVAAECWVSPRTVAFHLRNIFAKAGVTSRSALAQVDFI
jgi:DNA-binding CsgD family transcriptional regulator